MGFCSENAQKYAETGTDHHKAWEINTPKSIAWYYARTCYAWCEGLCLIRFKGKCGWLSTTESRCPESMIQVFNEQKQAITKPGRCSKFYIIGLCKKFLCLMWGIVFHQLQTQVRMAIYDGAEKCRIHDTSIYRSKFWHMPQPSFICGKKNSMFISCCIMCCTK